MCYGSRKRSGFLLPTAFPKARTGLVPHTPRDVLPVVEFLRSINPEHASFVSGLFDLFTVLASARETSLRFRPQDPKSTNGFSMRPGPVIPAGSPARPGGVRGQSPWRTRATEALEGGGLRGRTDGSRVMAPLKRRGGKRRGTSTQSLSPMNAHTHTHSFDA